MMEIEANFPYNAEIYCLHAAAAAFYWLCLLKRGKIEGYVSTILIRNAKYRDNFWS